MTVEFGVGDRKTITAEEVSCHNMESSVNIPDRVIKALSQELVAAGRRLFGFGMAFGTSGNISAVLPGRQALLVKKSGVCLGDADAEDFLMVDLDGNVLKGTGKPSKECRFHAGIYRVRSDVGAVVHVHPPYSTAFSMVANSLPLITVAGKAYLRRVPCVPDHTAGSQELADAVVGEFADPSIVGILMKAHGITAVGPDIVRASYMACVVEDSARVAYVTKQLQSMKMD